MRYLILDTETGCKEKYGRTAHFKYNPIVALGYKKYNEEVKSKYVWDATKSKEELDIIINNFFKEILQDVEIIVMHNASFDCLYYWKYPEFQNWLINGGIIWCTMFAEFNLTGQQHKFPALRDIAVNKYKVPARPKHIENLLFNKKNYKTNTDLNLYISKISKMYSIPENTIQNYKDIIDLPRDYVSIDVEDDCLDTENVFLQQYKSAINLNMVELLQLRMDGILALIEKEYNGFKVDVDKLVENQQELEEQYIKKHTEIINLAMKYWIT